MYLDLVSNAGVNLDSKLINESISHVFVHEQKLYTMHYEKGVTIVRDGDNPSHVLEFRRVMQNGEFIPCGLSITPVLLLKMTLEPELFNRETKFKIGDTVLSIATVEVAVESTANYYASLSADWESIVVSDYELTIIKSLENNVYQVHRDYDGITFKIFGELLCHKYSIIPFLR